MGLESFLAYRVQLLVICRCIVRKSPRYYRQDLAQHSSSLAEIQRNCHGIRVRHFGAVLYANAK